MPAIQAMRSDALAMRAKEDVQEKIPSFFNSVNQSLGSNIVAGQDAAEQLLTARFQAANALAAQIRQKVDGQGALADMAAGAGMKLISTALDVVLGILGKTTTTDAIQVASDIANFLLERETLQLQWDAIAATHAQWTVQAGYTGHGDFFDPETLGATLPYTVPVDQWLELSPGTFVASGQPAGLNGDLPQLEGSWTTVPYVVGVQTVPADLQAYKYQPRDWQNKPAVTYNLIDGDGIPETPDTPDPGNPTTPVLATAGITINKNGNAKWGDPGDAGSQVYYSATDQKYYIKYKFEVTQNYTVQATDQTLNIPIPKHTIVTAANSSGFDFKVHTTAAQTDFNSSNTFDTNFATATDYNGDLLFDFNGDGVVDVNDAQADNDYDGTLGNGQYINVGPTNGADDDNDGIVDNAGEIAYQYQAGTDIDDLLPHSTAMLTSVRSNAPTSPGTAYTEVVTIPGQNTTYYPFALGGRGALKYRDAYTPRYTDRTQYGPSTTGWGGGSTYDYYYNWGSVGSISRVGQYP